MNSPVAKTKTIEGLMDRLSCTIGQEREPSNLRVGRTQELAERTTRHGAGAELFEKRRGPRSDEIDPPAALPSDIARSAPAIIVGVLDENSRTLSQRVAAADIFC
jgi:hypothetical protein